MRIKNESLNKYTTIKIGGTVDILSIPETEDEFIKEIQFCQQKNYMYKIMGKGSNLLINNKIKGFVINNTKACTDISFHGSNIVYVGSSVTLQHFVNFCIDNNLGGMEYLYSIPATVGGAIYMNAGRGKSRNEFISDYLLSVKIYDGVDVVEIKKEECKFVYRSSIFQKNKNWIILGAKFRLVSQSKIIGKQKILERMEYVKNDQPRGYPNMGSIFKKKSNIAMKLINGLKIGDAKMEGNWINNCGNATYKQVILLIYVATFIQYLLITKPELEIEIWKN